MCQLIETICLYNGQLQNIERHQQRFQTSRKELLGIDEVIDLKHVIEKKLTEQNFKNLVRSCFKCRLVYGKEIQSIEFTPYIPKNVNSLQLIENQNIDYRYKYLDRSMFTLLLSTAKTDDVLITQNGWITDTSFANVVFFDGKNWITPTTFLLHGTKRQLLLNTKQITENEIHHRDLKTFLFARLINAMLDFENTPVIPIKQIFV